ncbi:thiamine diphosphokinase [Metabacillus arenae]|uniref:Thiamine diphosphokinase n=1 Tax=Metabacillus arenae TaxID=2771434 RepID=A0A926N9J0_9BACI|nr:thiamine diphosphokinase [Metabacillus arenae]MBD1380002.1 thiamine diphosphokinase [Metabacillus arenae]
MKKINLVAGGPSYLLPELGDYHDSHSTWVGIDKGAVYLLEQGIIPHIAFGDFDSVTIEEKLFLDNHSVKLTTFQAEKDATDTELALSWAIKQNPNLIRIFGATGGRLDHLLANLHIMKRFYNKNIQIKLIDRYNQAEVFLPDCYKVDKKEEYKYISFIPISEEVSGITLTGFKYPLNNCHIQLGSTLCISNELIHAQGTFSFTSGILLMIRSKD